MTLKIFLTIMVKWVFKLKYFFKIDNQILYGFSQDILSLEERQLLGRYGIWLLVGRCTPTTDTPIEILGRLLSMLFHWFHITAYSSDGKKL